MAPSIDLAGKRALVSGGSSDIGRAICLRLARAGATVAFTYFSDHEGAAATRQALCELGSPPRAASTPHPAGQRMFGVEGGVRWRSVWYRMEA